MSFLSDLRALIVANATAKSLAEAGNDAGVAALLNTPSVTVHRRATNKQLLRWLAQNDRSTKLRAAAQDAANGAKAIAQSALYVIESGLSEIDCDAEWWQMVDYLTTHPTGAPVLTEDDKTALQTRIAETIGQAEATLGRAINADDVSRALAGDRPSGQSGPIQ